MAYIRKNYEERECAYHGCRRIFKPRSRVQLYCSSQCYSRKKTNYPTVRCCRHCGNEFEVLTRADAARQHCSKQCSKASSQKKVRVFAERHPERRDVYRASQLAKNPNYERDAARRKRQMVLDMLGGACVVCGVTNPSWLHLDYIPTSIGAKYRHSRGPKFVREHLDDFRLLCANHHYELTLTGRIEGTEIVQARWTRSGVIVPS